MGSLTVQPSLSEVLAIAGRQHNLVTHSQLVDLGLRPKAIQHRAQTGRLHPIRIGVYAVGSPRLTRQGRWMAAVLSCGPGAVLSHTDAASLFGICPFRQDDIHVSVPLRRNPRQRGVTVHRRSRLRRADVTRHLGVPVTAIALTLVDLADTAYPDLEGAVVEADKRDLINPESLRAGLSRFAGIPGAARLGRSLDRHTFTLTDSELERRFLPIATRAGLSRPLTQEWVNGYRVDFYWPDLKLVVETDGLRYHRTPAQQTEDRRRDQAHTAAGLTPLRFTRAQVRFEPNYVEETLRAVRLGR